jgi:hypothetical protein
MMNLVEYLTKIGYSPQYITEMHQFFVSKRCADDKLTFEQWNVIFAEEREHENPSITEAALAVAAG